MSAVRLIAVVALLAAMGAGAASCSLANRRGPDATCATLSNGKINDCRDGILASCVGGALQYKVCDDAAACSAAWQEAGEFRCTETEPLPNVSVTACTNENTCPRATPYCYAAGGFCVQCMSDANCPSTTPKCDNGHACVSTNPIVCGFPYKNATCASCIQTNCCSASTACAANGDCTSCLTRPASSPPCVTGMVPMYDQLMSCIGSSCSSTC